MIPASSPVAIHHSVIVVGDLEASLRFYRDGLGLHVLQDRQVEGDWPGLFGAPSRTLRAVFLGGSPRRVTQQTPGGPITIAAVRDPDGLLVLLTPGSITRRT